MTMFAQSGTDKKHFHLALPARGKASENALTRLQEELATLRKSEKLHRLLLEKMTDLVWIMDLHFRTLYVNLAVERLLGFTPAERLRQPVEEQLTPDSLTLARETLARELAREAEGQADPGRGITMVLEYCHRDGSTRWLETIVTGIRDAKGRLTQLHGLSRDVTERLRTEEKLRERERQYQQLIESLPIAISLEVQGRVVYVNPAFLTLFRASGPEEILGSRITDFIPPELFDTIEQGRRIMIEEQVSLPPLEMNVRRRDGLVITVVSTHIPVTYAGQPAILGALIDITERKLSEIELQKARMLLQFQAREMETLKAKTRGRKGSPAEEGP
jgi:PAS domain S-box-containing protein